MPKPKPYTKIPLDRPKRGSHGKTQPRGLNGQFLPHRPPIGEGLREDTERPVMSDISRTCEGAIRNTEPVDKL